MIKKRTRPTTAARSKLPTDDDTPKGDSTEPTEPLVEEGEELSIADLLELQRIRKSKQGIDSLKLNKGVAKRRRRTEEEEEQEKGGLKPGTKQHETLDDEDDEASSRARKAVRSNNFTGQTNILDVDKHMMAYIEENLQVRGRLKEEEPTKPADPQDALYDIGDRWKVDKQSAKEGSVTNSSSMLTAIPEVDLGMDTRLRNIEDTEKAKQSIAEARADKKKIVEEGEEHLAANRFYRPNMKGKTDADILREAKMEAMGMQVSDDRPQRNTNQAQSATDEAVMERFKKRMRR
ncbi:hepatocellular carcinoma-associated antigen 59-domain-containing protein [Pterulicium gracile]|uniref:Hepatocellular carcinoma-associated antigen 59-domain-containing protein n=1 Tax=Pterulicium gracile TaxID=1884261 RepID=A0A5C3QQP9_9AGAR|nr:hepatocellular carcinoma-associated antigen 59-domain-containing protein [Pterula gracilis]